MVRQDFFMYPKLMLSIALPKYSPRDQKIFNRITLDVTGKSEPDRALGCLQTTAFNL